LCRFRDVGLANIQSVPRLVRQHPLLNSCGRADASLRRFRLLRGFLVAICQPVPHIGRRQDDQCDEDDAGQRTELASLRGEATIDTAHDLIRLCRVSDLILTLFRALLGSRALKIERFGFFSCYRHTQLLFPVLPE